MNSRIVPPHRQQFSIMPHMQLARDMAASWGEPIAIFRYNDGHPEDVFVRALSDLGPYRLADHKGLLMLEAVVNPPKEA